MHTTVMLQATQVLLLLITELFVQINTIEGRKKKIQSLTKKGIKKFK